MVNAQEWLDNEYPLENRGQIKKLNISRRNLEGGLDFSGFTNLEKLDCSFNRLYYKVVLKNCPNLIELNCSHNHFFERSFLRSLPSPQKLIKLNLLGNNFKYKWELDIWHHFYNLLEFNGEKRKNWIIRDWYGPGILTEWELLQERCEKLDEEMDEVQSKNNTLQIQLNAKEIEISWLKEQLKQSLGENEYKVQIEGNYPEKFL